MIMGNVVCYIASCLVVTLVVSICVMAMLYKHSEKFRRWSDKFDSKK